MNYDADIILVLKEAGESGLSVLKITKHVFNVHNSFFESPDYEKIHLQVYSFVRRNTTGNNPLLLKKKRGVYCLNPNSPRYKQLHFDFSIVDTAKDSLPNEKPQKTNILDLFS